MKTVKIAALSRTESGSSVSRRLRREGWVPCIVNDWTGKSTSLRVKGHEFEMMLSKHGRENLIAELEIEGGSVKKVLLREIQRDPIRNAIQHVDFQEISMTRKMRVDIPIMLVGDPLGVTQESGVLQHLLRTLHVECLPGDMVDSIKVDVTSLKVGDSVAVKDITVDPNLTVLVNGEVTIASVTAQTAEEEVAVEAAAVEGAASAEPEVITAKKPDEDEEGGEGGEKKDGKAKADGKPKAEGKGKVDAGGDKAKPEGKSKGK